MVGCKWIFKIKFIFDGTIAKCKAKLVANFGYIQQESINYQKTFSPVVKFISIKMFLAFVAHHGIIIFMYVDPIFLNNNDDLIKNTKEFLIQGVSLKC